MVLVCGYECSKPLMCGRWNKSAITLTYIISRPHRVALSLSKGHIAIGFGKKFGGLVDLDWKKYVEFG
jgi:hypothetical protein